MVTVHYLLFCLERKQKEREDTGMGEVAVSLKVDTSKQEMIIQLMTQTASV